MDIRDAGYHHLALLSRSFALPRAPLAPPRAPLALLSRSILVPRGERLETTHLPHPTLARERVKKERNRRGGSTDEMERDETTAVSRGNSFIPRSGSAPSNSA
jgi:hypothetical protein